MLEVVIAAALLGVVGLSFAYLYGTSQRFAIQSMNFTSAQGEASYALEHVRRNLLLATAVAQPPNVAPPGNQTAVLEFTWQPRSGVPPRTSRYERDGSNRLLFTPDIADSSVTEIIARSISAMAFNRAGVSAVSIDMTAQRTSGGDTRTTRLRTRVSPRGIFR